MITGLRNFVNHHIVGNRKDGDDFSPPAKGLSDGARLGIAAGWAALTTGVGAAIGATREGKDVVTYEQVPFTETVRVQVGTREEIGCHRYHYGYDFSQGEFGYHYGYDASCSQTVGVYEDQPTGRTLTKTLTHHSLNYPRTMLQGALVGLGIGALTGVAAYVLTESMKD